MRDCTFVCAVLGRDRSSLRRGSSTTRTPSSSCTPSTVGRCKLETAGGTNFRRSNARLELHGVASAVQVAWWPSTRSSSRMHGTNIWRANDHRWRCGVRISLACRRVSAKRCGTEHPVGVVAPETASAARVARADSRARAQRNPLLLARHLH